MPSDDMKNIFTGIAQNVFYPCKNNGKESFYAHRFRGNFSKECKLPDSPCLKCFPVLNNNDGKDRTRNHSSYSILCYRFFRVDNMQKLQYKNEVHNVKITDSNI